MSSDRYLGRRLGIWAASVALFWSAHSSTAQPGLPDETTELNLPTSPESWINSHPLSTQLLKGKAAVFYFYEEG